ncbi:MAG: glucokinase [Gammaproteobacteria bacterium]|nr:glucokinase [Gammaproteobacteria bacterium]
MIENSQYYLVADIGGTTSRLAIADHNNNIYETVSKTNCDYKNLELLVKDYLAGIAVEIFPDKAVFAVACPISGDEVELTNLDWHFSIDELCKVFSFEYLHVINDFVALSLAVPGFTAEDYVKIGAGDALPDSPIGVIGPGTGLGMSFLVPHANGWIPVSSEGGHVSLAPGNDWEDSIISNARKKFGHVSAERLLSGQGLPVLYQIIAELDGQQVIELDAGEISKRDIDKSDPVATNTIDTFMGLLGSVAGDMAVTIGAKGGIYIGGGILPKLSDRFIHSGFRQRFVEKGRFRGYLEKIPTFLITRNYASLEGLRNYVNSLKGS